jgi:hypothetical protein
VKIKVKFCNFIKIYERNCNFNSNLKNNINITCSAAGQWFSLGSLVYSTNKTDRHDITEILMKVALNTITAQPPLFL